MTYRGGIIHPAIVVAGRVVGSWRLRRDRKVAEVVLHPFGPLDPDLIPALAAETADIARFLDIEIALNLTAR